MTKAPRKYEKPLHVDRPFEEALERFARADPAEGQAMESTSDNGAMVLRETRISEDDNGNICLNDLWALAGSPPNRRASEWHRSAGAKALEAALVDRIMGYSHNNAKSQDKPVYCTVGSGKKQRTYAHPVLALDYAEFLNPSLGVEVREVFLRYRSNDISLANDILDRIAEQVREDEHRVHIRGEITVRNKELAGQGKQAGCSGWQYAELHNSGYRGLYNGLDEGGIHRLKKLTKNQKILDHMPAAEGAANLFRITQAAVAMRERKPATPQEAFDIAREAGVETRKAMKRIGGVMPEDMKPADSIGEAKKRLKQNKPLIEKD